MAIDSIKKYVRAANYISAAQIYLRDNFLLEKPLAFEHIKPRLLGHWGTCPGINFVYANLNYLIKKHRQSMLFVLGPGHGFPALQANLFIEGTLAKYYPRAKPNLKGLIYLGKEFSWPYGFPSHSNPGTPGVILEGGELGYSLSTSYGAILDNPDLIVACLVGDGEAETGPTATAWHINKFIDPAVNGAVLPILHLNGYKISGPTIFGRMSNKELESLFYGYGYDPVIVDEKEGNIYGRMIDVLENSYRKIKGIQKHAREKKEIASPRFPMIILRTPKGWTGIKRLNGEKIEDNCLSHQVVGKEAKTSGHELKSIEAWLKSYNFTELFGREDGFAKEITGIVPKPDFCMGQNRHAFGGEVYQKLRLPSPAKFSEDSSLPGIIGSSSMRRAGAYLNDVFRLNKHNFRLFSPDETYSNKLDEVFCTTSRSFVWPVKKWDKDISRNGRVIEMLSEHTLQGLCQGYILTGRHAVFASYEAFVEIVSSMASQYEKFLKASKDFPWRKPIASLNYILTSSGWRQEHNGFSHQNPKFISGFLEKAGCLGRVYFPPDGSSTLVVLKQCLESRNRINVIVAGKTVEPRWLTLTKAKEELKAGMMVWDFCSDSNPDIVFGGIGDYLTKECIAAISLLKEYAPEIKVRFVNVMEVTALGFGGGSADFNSYFTKDKPVIFNYHGYRSDIEALLLEYDNVKRFRVHGYTESGSTTTPFDMHIRNKTSRYHLVIETLSILSAKKIVTSAKAEKLAVLFEEKIRKHSDFIREFGDDPDEIKYWRWKGKH
ncbi:TPA: phosphoketolase family protein [Candidatus Woesearchaeota archaeon]|nr:phosphoketolase family protein [Candidatus Woesearchaeota archaeon]HIH41852.1 phosphoketolase family protein [Candidatus Woesearchaeota archaeon]